MIKKLTVYMVLFVVPLGILAQVGINTTTPLGVFHIDAKGDSQANEQNLNDDVIIVSDGRMGIGILPSPTTPKTRLQVDNSSGLTPVIRIEDPSEEATTDGKYLTSDTNGFGSWIPKTLLVGKVYRMTSPSDTEIVCPVGVDTPVLFNKVKLDNGNLVDNPNGYLKADVDGNYLLTIRWFGGSNYTFLTLPVDLEGIEYYEAIGEIKVRKVISGIIQNEDLDNVLVSDNQSKIYNGRNTFITSIFIPNVVKGEEFSILVKPSLRIGYDWIIGWRLTTNNDQFQNITYFPSVTFHNI